MRPHGSRHVEGTCQVGADHAVPGLIVFQAHRFPGFAAEGTTPGVVHQYVDPAVSFDDLRDSLLNGEVIAHIAGEEGGLTTGPSNLVLHGLAFFLPAGQ